jgi:23S rRNA (cytidine1920-2'-O)/16S rRNA (cytidine1409-2'-O)-methyltransferase
MKKRLDQHLADEGYFETRARARAAVMEGLVSLEGNRQVKAGTQVDGTEHIVVEEPASKYVSRGGVKLAGALEEFGVSVEGERALDVGASTGGFTDCLLQAGAASVVAVDVGKGQLHWKLRSDPRVTVFEGVNAREIISLDLPFEPDLAVVDVSFISLKKVVGPVSRVLREGAPIVALVKPQFEAGIGKAPKGVVKDVSTLFGVLRDMRDWLRSEGFLIRGVAPSRIRGPKGNAEFFILVERGGGKGPSDEELWIAIDGAPAR